MTVQVEPTKEQVNYWIENFVPKIDLFFTEEKNLKNFNGFLNEVLVIPREEFFNHSSYNQIHLVNSYMYWTLSKKVKYIIVAKASWISKLPPHLRKLMLEIQLEMGTGLTIPASLFNTTDSIPSEHIIDRNNDINNYFNQDFIAQEQSFVVIRSEMWRNTPIEVKENVIKGYAEIIYESPVTKIPKTTPTHLKAYVNKFSKVAGSNCLASTLFAITGDAWILDEWVHPETFMMGLFNNNYSLIGDDIQEGDVVTWVNSNNVVQHASYHIINNIYFNKSGQSFFEPWTVTTIEEINRTREEYEIKVYRKNKESV